MPIDDSGWCSLLSRYFAGERVSFPLDLDAYLEQLGCTDFEADVLRDAGTEILAVLRRAAGLGAGVPTAAAQSRPTAPSDRASDTPSSGARPSAGRRCARTGGPG